MYASLQPIEDTLLLEYGESIMAKEQTEKSKAIGVFFLIFKKGLINLNMDSHLPGLRRMPYEKKCKRVFSPYNLEALSIIYSF